MYRPQAPQVGDYNERGICAFWQCWGSWTGYAGVSMAGRGVRPDSIFQAFEWVCKAAGIEGLTFHDLRYEATSRLFEEAGGLCKGFR